MGVERERGREKELGEAKSAQASLTIQRYSGQQRRRLAAGYTTSTGSARRGWANPLAVGQ